MKAFADLFYALNDIFDVLAGILDQTNVYHDTYVDNTSFKATCKCQNLRLSDWSPNECYLFY